MHSISVEPEELKRRAVITRKVIARNVRLLRQCGFVVDGGFSEVLDEVGARIWVGKKFAATPMRLAETVDVTVDVRAKEFKSVRDVVLWAWQNGYQRAQSNLRTAIKRQLGILE